MHQSLDHNSQQKAAARLLSARQVVALSGAGISVPSGIPDFRSRGGLWSRFPPEEYATLDVFLQNPAKAWRFFRIMAAMLADKAPNPAHYALAELEARGRLAAIITQNIDGLHQAAGSRNVVEIHGVHHRLHCLRCPHEERFGPAHLDDEQVPTCPDCGFPLKPKVVLFGENVMALETVHGLAAGCDLLLVIGTSAQVYPAAALPSMVTRYGGIVIEMNREPSLATATGVRPDLFLGGNIADSLPALLKEVAGQL